MPPKHSQAHDRHFTVGNCQVRLTNRSLADLGEHVDALVSSDDNYLSHGGGVSGALWRVAGEDQVSADAAAQGGRWSLGDVVVTVAGRLKADYLFHAVSIDFDLNRRIGSSQLTELYARLFDIAEQRKCARIGLPLVASGAGRVPAETSASLLVKAIQNRLSCPLSILRIVISAPGDRFPLVVERVGTLASWSRSFGHLQHEALPLLEALRRRYPEIAEPLTSLLHGEPSSGCPEVAALLFGAVQTAFGDPPSDLSQAWSEASRVRNRLAHSSQPLRWSSEVTALIWTALEWIRRELGTSHPSPPLPGSSIPYSELPDLRPPASVPIAYSGPAPETSASTLISSIIVKPVGTGHVRQLHKLLLDELSADARRSLDAHLTALGYEGDFDLRLLEHCIRAEDPAELLTNEFTRAALRQICERTTGEQPKATADSRALARNILTNLGFPSPVLCHGPQQVLDAIQQGRYTVRLAGSAPAAAVVHDVAPQLEFLCHVLLRFLCQAAFKEPPERRLVARGKLKRDADLSKQGLGQLLILCESMIKDVQGANTSEAHVFRYDVDRGSPLPEGLDALSKVRNAFSHFKPGEKQPSAETALEFLDKAEALVLALTQPGRRLLPYVVSVTSIVVDRWGRRTITAVNDEGLVDTIFTDEDLQPGATYFLYPVSNPLRVDPILIPAGDVVWRD